MIYYLSVLLLVLPPVRMLSFFLMIPPPPRSTLFPYTTLFRSRDRHRCEGRGLRLARRVRPAGAGSGLLHLRGRGEPQHRPSHHRAPPRQDLCRVRARRGQGRHHGRLRRVCHRMSWNQGAESAMTSTATADSRLKKLDVSKLLVEGRAFLALAVIIVVFTILSPNYLTVNKDR